MDRLAHKGKMNAFLAAEQGSIEISNSLNKQKRQSSFERVEADNAPNKKNKTDENSDEDMLEISFVSTSSGGSYPTDTSKTNDNDELIPYVLAFDELISLKSSDFENSNCFSKHIGFEERFSNDGVLIIEELSENFEIFIKKWSRSIQNKMNFFIIPTSPDQVQLLTTLSISVTQVFKYREISKLESMYNFRVIWRFLDAATMVIPCCQFIPGETRLKAITQELKRQGLSTLNYYNADGVILDKEFDVELVLLETSGPFGLNDITRETTYHIKAAYGLLAMLHMVAYNYIYADVDIFKQLKICFVHAANNRIRLWSFSLVSKELYVLNRITSSTLPTDHSNSKDDLMNTTNTMWELKKIVEEASKVLKKIKRSHKKNEQIVQEGNSSSEVKRLDTFLVDIAEVKLSSRVSEAEDIYVFSSPIQPDSPSGN
ncbi:hypothetical protein G6F46_001860 [Rhizopus delemar]|nr:hypothetical protein G6F55_007573 [Rhizopus delemar]KAG1546323.1 hypothetical protein G6F51_004946 [Rhizopus arrhizus]KAG1497879.1 hypothetical protein G6F54_005464 [Rhizopus delemar]KAG1517262.1 hypothetical protein G6F53_001503 [Rhizopus delemar]KAG1561422.1 hypothetical protein G6F49_001830 [Rhizopus delemar]